MIGISTVLRWRKLWRFVTIYGPRRALVKAAGRIRGRVPFRVLARSRGPRVAIVGCGQFAFSTLAYFLSSKCQFHACFDVDDAKTITFSQAWGVRIACRTADEIWSDPTVDLVFVASNHASHADYASNALSCGKDVYVEKPVAVDGAQLARLKRAIAESSRQIYAGYNRPFSRAVRELRTLLAPSKKALTLCCFVAGHVLDKDHWYRRPEEGTRISGNVGHWIDLAIHMLNWRALPNSWKISLRWSNDDARDDDLAISLASDAGDLVSIVLTSRTEPFEGIHETINLQWGDVIANIDDFRRMTLWKGCQVIRRRYWPKDVGHRAAIRQPFSGNARAWTEVEDSTLLMLKIAEMVKRGISESDFHFDIARQDLVCASQSVVSEGARSL